MELSLFKKVYAQLEYVDVMEQNSPTKGSFIDLQDYAGVAINILLGTGVAISFIALILSGIKYMSARSDYKALDSAKQSLTYSIVATVLVVGAFAIYNILVNILTG